ncbi:uncharacterized protein EDB91DRAFT_1097530 [Suillus paluster]|uniref:uncharacterized protein n=1 Tax=Suillus paluster TaxID=48578 RepID=UPI001B861FFD|nr:uncharacterized protein EDB91DRAFT_1097530 [Suillus paluster]KAG1755144.1 hypothetical protein EDB91DRAFT_1097530 [Suillus paluster]
MFNASSTCNLGYTLVSSAAWSNNNCDIELILSDIPFISVGILTFGASAFFLVIRQLTFSVVSLYFSVLLSFAAAIIDLTQILIRDFSQVTVQPLITARDVLLALHYLHSGNWARWGVAGSYAKFGLLATIPAITSLQIVWRLFQRYQNYGPVYAANVALEVLVSVLLLLKLLLNTVPTSSIPRSHTFGEYGFPILALVFNIGISIGDLIRFAFTESILGRLLQGVELCILIVFMMILYFFRHKKTTTVPKIRDLAMLKKLPEHPRESTFRLSPPLVSTPRLTTPLSSENQGRSVDTDVARHSALATHGRASPWVSWRMSHRRSTQDEEKAKLWYQNDAGRGALDQPDMGQGRAGDQSMNSAASAMGKGSTEWRYFVNDSVPSSSALSMLNGHSVSTGSRNGSLSSGQILHAIRADIPPRPLPPKLQTMSLTAIPATATSSDESGATVIMTAPPDPPAQGSPIYGFKGVTRQPPSRQSSSNGSLEELLELQNELDKTIAALRLFSPSSPTSTSPISPLSSRSDSNYAEQMRQSSSTSARTLSDFSLSNFPSPPWLISRVPSLPAPLPAAKLRLKEDRRARLRFRQDSTSDALGLLLPPRIPAALTDMPSSPRSDLMSDSPYQEDNRILPADAGRSLRFNSGGTQYEITSFIGDLTTPGGHRKATTEKPLHESGGNSLHLGIDGSYGSREASPHLPTTPLRPSRAGLLRLPSSARHRLSQLLMQTRLSLVPKLEEEASDPNFDSVEPLAQRRMRPLILPSMTITSPPHFQPLNISSGARLSRGMTSLPQRPQVAPDFGVPRPLPEDVHDPGAFERLRPPPLILRSDHEYFSRGSR